MAPRAPGLQAAFAVLLLCKSVIGMEFSSGLAAKVRLSVLGHSRTPAAAILAVRFPHSILQTTCDTDLAFDPAVRCAWWVNTFGDSSTTLLSFCPSPSTVAACVQGEGQNIPSRRQVAQRRRLLQVSAKLPAAAATALPLLAVEESCSSDYFPGL